MQAHKPSVNLPMLPVPAPPVATTSRNSQLQCEGLSSALNRSSVEKKGNFCYEYWASLNPNTIGHGEPKFHISLYIIFCDFVN